MRRNQTGVSPPTRASEFPNDNPRVSDGAVWVCPEVRGRARPWRRPAFDFSVDPRLLTVQDAALAFACAPREPESESRTGFEQVPPEIVWLEPEPMLLESELAVSVLPEPPASDPFSEFMAAMADVLSSRAATRAAACLPALLGEAPFRASTLGAELSNKLAERGLLAPGGSSRSEEFEATGAAWRRVLRGESDDLSSCGTTTLDRFGAELLAALLGIAKSRADELRRELRSRGVAAFGMISQAA